MDLRGIIRAAVIAAVVMWVAGLLWRGDNKESSAQEYKTVMIDGKTWMAENLNVATAGSWCYDDADSNCIKYGRLYTWEAAKSACLSVGWRLPTIAEWNALVRAAGGSSVAGKALKSKTGWTNYSSFTNDDTYGFSAMPGGRRYIGGSFGNVGDFGYWWTVTELDSSFAYRCAIGYDGDYVGEYDYDVRYGFSVRCVADVK